MQNILFIGLDSLVETIINYLNKTDIKIYGYDFKYEKIDHFYQKNIITNSDESNLKKIIKNINIVILNISYTDYNKIDFIIKSLNKDTFILNTNIYKEDSNNIETDFFKNKKFLSCNFLLFPEKIIINYDEKTNINLIFEVSKFLKKLNSQIYNLKIKENNEIFSILYQIPYLINKFFFSGSDQKIINENKKFINRDLFLEDIILNKNINIKNINELLSTLNLIKNKNDLENLLKSKNDYQLNTTDDKIDMSICFKIIIEKIYIKNFSFLFKNLYYDNNYLKFSNFDYNIDLVKDFLTKDENNLTHIIDIIKEKLKTIISFLQIKTKDIEKMKELLKLI